MGEIMNKYNDKYLHTVTILIIVLGILTSTIGLWDIFY